MKIFKLTGLIMLLLIFIANGQTMMNNDWKIVDNEDFYFRYPKNWTLDITGQMGSSFIIFSELSSTKDNFRENINLLVQDLQNQPIGLDKFVEISSNQIKLNVKNGKIIESRRMKGKNSDFHKMIYSGDKADMKYKFVQYYWIKNGNAFILTFSCDLNEFGKYKATGEAIMNSFELK